MAAVERTSGSLRGFNMRINTQSIWSLAQRQIRWVPLALSLAVFSGIVPLYAFQAQEPLTGRQIAPVMGAAGADWLNRPERAAEEHPDQALDALQIKPGMVVADVGAGTGYMTLRLARRVGPSGTVYGEDIQPEMLRMLRQNASAAKLNNIQLVLGTESDPKLPTGKLDLILLVDVYHEFSQPEKMLDHMRTALKPDGRLVLLEYRKEDPTIPIQPLHKMSVQEVKTELEAEGFKLTDVIETLPRQHILILHKAPVQ